VTRENLECDLQCEPTADLQRLKIAIARLIQSTFETGAASFRKEGALDEPEHQILRLLEIEVCLSLKI
jgi:hypothetical protein